MGSYSPSHQSPKKHTFFLWITACLTCISQTRGQTDFSEKKIQNKKEMPFGVKNIPSASTENKFTVCQKLLSNEGGF
jgi:hypothetical protein